MKIKKILALMAAGTMLMTMGGCNAITIDGEENVREGSSGNVIGFSVSTLNNPFFVTLTEGARKAATENNVELVVVDAGDDAAKQTSDIEDLVSRNVGVLIVNPVDSDAVGKERHVPGDQGDCSGPRGQRGRCGLPDCLR